MRGSRVLPAAILLALLHLTSTLTKWLDPAGAAALRLWWRDALGPLGPWGLPAALVPLFLPSGPRRAWAWSLAAWLLLASARAGSAGRVGDALAGGMRSLVGEEGLVAVLALGALALLWTAGALRWALGVVSAARARAAASARARPRPARKKPAKAKARSERSPATGRKARKPRAKPPARPTGYSLPLDLLKPPEKAATEPKAELDDMAAKVRSTLLEVAGVEADLIGVDVGRSVLRFEWGVPASSPLGKIRRAAENIALSTASVGKVRVVAPVLGKGTVAVEIPRRKTSTLRLSEALKSGAAPDAEKPLSFVMGAEVDGTLRSVDLAGLPHMLIAGATQSGKSVFINTLLLNLLYRNSPQALRLILMDMKRVELTFYRDIPHLLVPIVATTDAALNAMDWACQEVDRRYEALEGARAKNLVEYNRKAAEPLPFIVMVIDELSPLLDQGRQRVREALSDLSERARAAGVHLVASMQRPDARKLDGSIKANLPGKVSFRLGTMADSTTIFGRGGAEDLLGRGDLYFDSPQHGDLIRLQAPLVETEEIEAVLDHLRSNFGTARYDAALQEALETDGEAPDDTGIPPKDREILEEIRDALADEEAVSVSQLQRQFGIGYNKAARLMMTMERLGWVAQDANAAAGKKSWTVRIP